MDTMNDNIREAVRIELARRRSNQTRLAQEVGVSPQYVSEIMNGRTGNVPAVWARIFDSLDLELTVRPKSEKSRP